MLENLWGFHCELFNRVQVLSLGKVGKVEFKFTITAVFLHIAVRVIFITFQTHTALILFNGCDIAYLTDILLLAVS